MKTVGGIDVYVKSDNCEEHIRELIRILKFDDTQKTQHLLGSWSFLQRDLLPLLIFHDKDKKLSFLTLMLLVQLTEPPPTECQEPFRTEILRQQLAYKEEFLSAKVISTLMSHLADCL